MFKKYLSLLPMLLLIATLLSSWFLASITFALGLISLLLSLALTTYAIYTKYTGTERARAKILKEVGVMVLTLVIVIFLGGIASMLANVQVGMRWGEVAGLLSALGASFGACPEPVEGGYFVRVGVGRLAKT